MGGRNYNSSIKSDRNPIPMGLELPGEVAHLWKGQEFAWVSATIGL